MSKTRLYVALRKKKHNGIECTTVVVTGRMRWALLSLVQAGQRGCTSFSHPAPRWSAYVHSLRQLGLPIETQKERHFGDFPGTHARYVLQCKVERST